MKINDTTQDFFHLLEQTQDLTVSDLDDYYDRHPEVFTEYFQFHCPKTVERLATAISRYPQQLEDIQKVATQLPTIIKKLTERFASYFNLKLDLTFHLLVGGYGSNAFVERKIIGDVFFAVEKLSSKREHFEVIVAHEIAHIYHNAISDRAKMDWKAVDWTHGLISLYREGIATYLSQQIVRKVPASVYYSYDENGDEWLHFCQHNHAEIAHSFLKDADNWTFEKEQEWFRLSGGKYFGYSRLGYYLGTQYVADRAREKGEEAILTWWNGNDSKEATREWLRLQI